MNLPSKVTDVDGNVVVRPQAWSFSALEGFENCALKHYETKVAKNFKDDFGPDAKWGNRVHDALADRVAKGTPLPDGMQQWEKWAQWALRHKELPGMVIYAERKMALTAKFRPCEYFDKSVPVWFRTVADVLKINGQVARIIDWKTGKPKEDTDQIKLSAAAVFATFPVVEAVAMNFVWLKEDYKTDDLIRRVDLPAFWQTMLPRVDEFQLAHATGVFPPSPSGLCKRHCPVSSCAYHGKGNR
jgi:hypothetical protein